MPTVDDVVSLFGVLIHEAYAALDVIWVAGDDTVDAAAVWLPPDQVARFDEVETATRPKIAAAHRRRRRPVRRVLGLARRTPPGRAVLVPRHPRGARAGTRARARPPRWCATASNEHTPTGLPAFLETGNPANVAMYEHLGFRVHERADAARRRSDDLVPAGRPGLGELHDPAAGNRCGCGTATLRRRSRKTAVTRCGICFTLAGAVVPRRGAGRVHPRDRRPRRCTRCSA